MTKRMFFAVVPIAALASAFCLAGGLWILSHGGLDANDPLGSGIGLYFVGKGLFVGPMLLLARGHSR